MTTHSHKPWTDKGGHVTQDTSISVWNVGLNSGEATGKTVFHAHWHLIPRREGDCEEPRGGVRGVIPTQQGY
ncbi:HIT family protein [Cyanobium sp. NIES-981]|uniref:HIT family protein n=1 Tax=Cyanobium sp. NIES-981 TaxID=1851505 RepID=UPI0035104F9B